MNKIEDQNKLIAEFMGYQLKGRKLSDEMIYDTSWDWLMPVVEKIEEHGYDVIIRKDNVEIMCENVRDIECFNTGKHITTYQAVVEFIKRYNETK